MSLPRRSFRLAALALLLQVAPPSLASAHDFWIEPVAFRCEVDSILAVELRVGDEGLGEKVRRNPERIASFEYVGPTRTKPLVGLDGHTPAGNVRVDEAGLGIVAYTSNVAYVGLAAPKFEAYLREVGLEFILDQRRALGEEAKPSSEAYSRCCKSLVRAGAAASAAEVGWNRRVGHVLELTPVEDPFRGDLDAEHSLRLELCFEGRPLEGALVRLFELPPTADAATSAATAAASESGSTASAAREAMRTQARTDAKGRVRLPAPASGRILVCCVHMTRGNGAETADWRSFWSSLTLER